MKLNKMFATASITAALFGFGGAAQAAPVALELALLVDVSGSVNASDYSLQKTGYINAFNDPGIQAAISGLAGGIAVTYIEWSGSGQQAQLVGWTHITNATSASDFADAIAGTSRAYSGLTGIAGAINFVTPLFLDNGFEGARWVIDVSGDGTENVTSVANLNAARDAFLNTLSPGEGFEKVINGLAILTDVGNLDVYYANNVIGGPGSFVEAAATFADFERAVISKIGREITGVPEPATLALLGLGMLGLGAMRRKKA